MAPADSLVVPLARAPGPAVVGGKGASLGTLIRAGIPVPAGFVVTVDAFAGALGAADPAGKLRAGIEALDAADLAATAARSARMREVITAAPLPGALDAAIARAYAALGAERDVAVRSSATMEDSAAASF